MGGQVKVGDAVRVLSTDEPYWIVVGAEGKVTRIDEDGDLWVEETITTEAWSKPPFPDDDSDICLQKGHSEWEKVQ